MIPFRPLKLHVSAKSVRAEVELDRSKHRQPGQVKVTGGEGQQALASPKKLVNGGSLTE